MNLVINGGQVVITKDRLKFTPEGQLLMDFSSPKKSPVPFPLNLAKELFFQTPEYERVDPASEWGDYLRKKLW